MQRTVTKILPFAPALPKLKRVAGYARVSSGKDAMLHSLSAQVSYYNSYIQEHKGWEFAGIFVDEALTGTKENRSGFQEMLEACRDGKVDMVITKSITRFARNTVTLLETTRELKSLGVDIFFEKENIHSMSEDGELMLAILASYAQEESRSASENCKWRIRRMFQEGRPNHDTILGYRLVDGTYYILQKEATIVKYIFQCYISGMGRQAIAKNLDQLGYVSRLGRPFTESSIAVILRNEKYTGDMVLQKTYVSDHISKKKCVNRGELPMYVVEQSHEPIIDKDTFNRVQHELARRAKRHHPQTTTPERYVFSGMIRCGICGSYFRRKHANAGGKYERIVWICNVFNSRGKETCPSRQIPDKILKSVAVEVLGLSTFDESIFASQIKEIQVPAVDRLVFVFCDGHTEERVWQNPSRSLSWDEEARKRQSEMTKRRYNT